nr:hypothetical protein [Rhodococcus sp. (in: high G+C Gram-positive bacteria)]
MTTPVATGSINPLKYTPAQLAKAGVALLTALVALLGFAATNFVDGPLATVGGYAAVAALVLNPIVVFLKQAAPVISVLGNPFGTGPTQS